MIKNKKRGILALFSLLFLLGSANFVYALEINYPPVPGALPPQEFVGTAPQEQIVSLYALYIFNLAIWLAGAIALGVLIYAGLLYLTSAANPERMTQAREQITASFFGILLLLSSYIILQILNPELTLLQAPELTPPRTFEEVDVPGLALQPFSSSIDAEIPVGRILEEKVFASSTIARIKENASTTLDLASELAELNTDLREETKKCRCYKNTVPDPKPVCPSCTSERCTSDTCDPQRADIVRIQQEEILPRIDKLKTEQQKTAREVRLLREELTKLARVKNYLPNECRLWTAQSLSEFLIKVDDFEAGDLRQIKFWDDMTSIREKDKTRDWASFYCPVGGTTFTQQPSPPGLEEPAPEFPAEYAATISSCPAEAPVGDILDRADRTAKLLIEKLEKLIDLQGEMIEAADQMTILASQYSSDNCFPVTYAIRDHTGRCVGCVEVGCFGLPGPYWEVQCQEKGIETIKDRIERLVLGAGEEEIEEMPFCGDVRDLPLAKKREFYNSCNAEYNDIASVTREGWIQYAQNNLECYYGKFGSTCEWKGTASGLRDFVDSYVRARVSGEVLENFDGLYCKLPERKLEMSRINEYLACLGDGPPENIEFCYGEMEARYGPEDSGPCVATCVEEKIKKELGPYEPGEATEAEELGIIPILEKKVPPILRDWDRDVWLTMQQCVTKGGGRVLFDTQRAVGALDPEGVVIRTACEQEPVFLECQEQCYLEEGQEKYTQCLNTCLDEEAEEFGEEQIGWCRNRLNFFCCSVSFEPIE